MNKFAYLPNPTGIKFIVKNATGTKFVNIFGLPIGPGFQADLMQIPGIAEEQIRDSLVKGELYVKIRQGEIIVVSSNVNLISFDSEFMAFLNHNGITTGTTIPNSLLESPLVPDIEGTYFCSVNIQPNQFVYLFAADVIDLALGIDGYAPCIGIVKSKPTITSAVVLYYGEFNNFSGLTPGATYYIDDTTPGAITSTPPTAPGTVVQSVGFARDTFTLVLMIGRQFSQN